VCDSCFSKMPYSEKENETAKKEGFDLDDWNDYQRYFQLGEDPEEY
jgi:hypothetical protein